MSKKQGARLLLCPAFIIDKIGFDSSNSQICKLMILNSLGQQDSFSRFIVRTGVLLFNFILTVFVFQACTQKSFAANEWDSTFNPIIGGAYAPVSSPILQPDGKVIVKGDFHIIGGGVHPKIARLNQDGSLDTTFNPLFPSNEFLNPLTVQPDGKILVSSSATAKILRLNPDGSIDASFNSGTGANGGISSIGLLPDGRIIVAGNFTNFNGVTRRQIARLNYDGTLDNDFAPLISSLNISDLAIQPDGKILICGALYAVGTIRRDGIARLNADGTLDSSFNPGTGFNDLVNKIIIQPDGKILAGGQFSSYNGTGRLGTARLNSNGTLDESFNANINVGSYRGRVFSVTFLPDGKVFITGDFDNVNGLRRVRIARVNQNGSVDESFNPGTGVAQDSSSSVYATSSLYLPDGKILITGNFFSINGIDRYGLAALNNNGTVAETFIKGAHYPASILKIIPQPNAKIIIGGNFYSVNGVDRKSLARLNADGSLDSSFNINLTTDSGSSGTVWSGALQQDGKILIAGEFVRVNGSVRSGIVRINTDNTIDSTFSVLEAANLIFRDIKIQPDGKIVAGSSFGVKRFNADGSVDNTWVGAANDSVRAVAIQPDGKIIIVGNFTAVNGTNRNRIARLNVNGSIDPTFVANANQTVNSAALSQDGKILVAGDFTVINSTSLNRLARLNTDGSLDTSFNIGSGANRRINTLAILPDGKILVAGIFNNFAGANRERVVRLKTNGTIDLSFAGNLSLFAQGGEGANVSALALQSNGSLLIGGYFTSVNASNTTSLLRLPASRQTPFDFDGDGRADISVYRTNTWYIQRSQAGFTGTQWGASGDLIAPADYDGDGKTDYAVFRPTTGYWYILQSSNNQFVAVYFGTNGDLPRPADFDGDGLADVSVFRPSNGYWYRQNSSNNQFVAVKFGSTGDVPVIGDFDGDQKSDITVFRPSNGSWYRLSSLDNQFIGLQFGTNGDIPAVGDFDGDGKSDISVFRPTAGAWYRINSSNNQFVGLNFGIGEDIPTPADYDGDGKTDVSVFRPSNGHWYRQNSANNGFYAEQFGVNGDRPAPGAFNQ
jgi:uncharacterized delta-60 repeat protein